MIMTDYDRNTTHSLSECCLPQIGRKIAIFEGHIASAKVRVLQRSSCNLRETLPRNERLTSPYGRGETALVVDGPHTVVLDQRLGAVEGISVGGTVPPTMGRRTHGEDVIRGRGRSIGQPHNHSLPVMSVAQTRRRLVLGKVPRIHQGVFVARAGSTDVDLSGAAVAVRAGAAAGVQSRTGLSGSRLRE